jgi:hypothetical protein
MGEKKDAAAPAKPAEEKKDVPPAPQIAPAAPALNLPTKAQLKEARTKHTTVTKENL